jgi:hypothetical protein
VDKQTKDYLNSLTPEDRERVEHYMDALGVSTFSEWGALNEAKDQGEAACQVDRVVEIIEAGEKPGRANVGRALLNVAKYDDIETPPTLLEYAGLLLVHGVERGRNPKKGVKSKLLPSAGEAFSVVETSENPSRDTRIYRMWTELKASGVKGETLWKTLSDKFYNEFPPRSDRDQTAGVSRRALQNIIKKEKSKRNIS